MRAIHLSYSGHRHLPSFPTRRSSDLGYPSADISGVFSGLARGVSTRRKVSPDYSRTARRVRGYSRVLGGIAVSGSVRATYGRSEEHTSELQSRENLVCRLLLEEKNKL